MPIKEECCDTCCYYQLTMKRCRRYPPVYWKGEGSFVVGYNYPVVMPNMWCGEYKYEGIGIEEDEE